MHIRGESGLGVKPSAPRSSRKSKPPVSEVTSRRARRGISFAQSSPSSSSQEADDDDDDDHEEYDAREVVSTSLNRRESMLASSTDVPAKQRWSDRTLKVKNYAEDSEDTGSVA